MARSGVDMIRVNASHADAKSLLEWIKIAKNMSDKKHRLPVLLDLQGPRIRTGSLKNKEGLILSNRQVVEIVIGNKEGDENTIYTPCDVFSKIVAVGDPILIDNGLIQMTVMSKKKNSVTCRVIHGGKLGENKGINLPHAPSKLPALTEKDKRDLNIGLKAGVDVVALSFVRTQEDVLLLKRYIARKGYSIPVIAKIEKPKAITNYSDILSIADGVMIARGDLGIEIDMEKVPVVQKRLIQRAKGSGKTVIVATQMLESMIENARPTRAEVSDIANAVWDGTDAVMLSGETAVGKYPIRSIQIMRKVIRESESYTTALNNLIFSKR